ncbi:uncharacterized protein LOC127279861 isoform X2 [Leptopilina boulardi]|uniref:uncharacterized protein LOC127279861 isoform X2 n=1 Tax=Leptopilina boulardi TaxID=63433 RepID=UPI0021F67960|nr:uncharacterized protein LOC127279861 isoform X2 [Leptopilina boulardi]
MKYGFESNGILINILKIKAAFVTIFLLLVPINQVNPVYNREIQCLADFLKPEECEKLLGFFDSLKATNYNNSTECFQRLANWTLHLKWKQKDTYAMLKNRFRQIGGRTNLVSLIHNCFTRFRREIVDETIDDWGFYPVPREDGEKSNLEESFTKGENEEKEEGQKEGKFSNSLRSRSIFSSLNSTSSDYPCLKLNPYVILGIVGFIVLCVCCSTLVIRRKLANCFKSCCKRKKKESKKSSGKYSPIDAEKGRKSPRKKKMSFSSKPEERNDESSKVLINTATQDSNPSVRRVDDDSPPSGCCQCCKKKKKKRKKSTKRKK